MRISQQVTRAARDRKLSPQRVEPAAREPQPLVEAQAGSQAAYGHRFKQLAVTASVQPAVQARLQRPQTWDARSSESIEESARLGTSGAAERLPFLSTIQRSFGRHDVSGIVAHTDAAARAGSLAMGAAAFAVGSHVAFGTPPMLATAAHEAAHVVQQRAGVHLAGGVGQAGDRHEQHADMIADRVVKGQSSEGLLDRYARPTSPAAGFRAHSSASPISGAAPIQRMLLYKGAQFAGKKDLAGNKGAFDAYLAHKDEDKEKKLKDPNTVYDLEDAGLGETKIAPLTSTPSSAPSTTLAPVKGSTIKGLSQQELRAQQMAAEMTRIESIVRGATISFTGNRWNEHLKGGGDGQAQLQDQTAVEVIIQNANAADMYSPGPGKTVGTVAIQIFYGNKTDKLSIIFEFKESKQTAKVYHVGPGG